MRALAHLSRQWYIEIMCKRRRPFDIMIASQLPSVWRCFINEPKRRNPSTICRNSVMDETLSLITPHAHQATLKAVPHITRNINRMLQLTTFCRFFHVHHTAPPLVTIVSARICWKLSSSHSNVHVHLSPRMYQRYTQFEWQLTQGCFFLDTHARLGYLLQM